MNKIIRKSLYLLIISAITAIFGVLAVVGVSAEVGDTFTVNTVEGAPITYKATSEGEFPEVEVASCHDNYNGTVTLPESVVNPNNNLEYSITGIGYSAFCRCYNLTSVTIPDSVTTIGDWAFSYCGSLTDVTIPESVTTIGDYAFCGCSSLTSVLSYSKSPSTLGKDVFDYCPSDLTIYIPLVSEKAYVAAGWPEANLVEQA